MEITRAEAEAEAIVKEKTNAVQRAAAKDAANIRSKAEAKRRKRDRVEA